jgi:hypothetical protein
MGSSGNLGAVWSMEKICEWARSIAKLKKGIQIIHKKVLGLFVE